MQYRQDAFSNPIEHGFLHASWREAKALKALSVPR